MFKKLLFVGMILLSASAAKAQYQFPNSTFDADFIGSYDSFTEPEGWHGYASIDASQMNETGRSGEKLVASDDVREGATGKCVYIKSSKILSVIANGVMTNGQIYTHSTKATDGTSNYNFSDATNSGSSTYGANNKFFTEFTGRPDSMRVWLRFVPKNSSNGNARVSVYTHLPNTKMYDPTDNANMSIVVAHAEQSVPECDWTCYSLPFSYSSTADPGLILATFTTNETPGKGGDGDLLYIDDIEMVYLSTLVTCTYNGEAVTFENGVARVDAAYNARLLKYTTGAGAKVETTGPTKENGYLLTITIKGNNISEDSTNTHTYQIRFSGINQSEGDDESEVTVVPQTPAASALADARFYFYSVAQGGYLTTGDQLSDEPELYYTINQSAGTVLNQNGGYFTLDRLSYSSSLDYSKFVVYSDNGTAYDVLTFTQTSDNSLRLYRKNLKYNAIGKNADIYLGASGMTTLTACSATDDNGLWQLIDPAAYLPYYLSSHYTEASLAKGITRDLAVFNNQSTTTLENLPLGLYSIDGGEIYYLPSGTNLTLTQANTTLTYYGRLDLTLDAAYNGTTLIDGMTIEDVYDESKLKVQLSGNGQQRYDLSFDEETYVLTLTISGYGRCKEYTIQFAAPDLSLHATWYGQKVVDGQTINEAYDATKLVVTPGVGATSDVQYDSTTGEATITLTDGSDTQTYTLHFAVIPAATKIAYTYSPLTVQNNGSMVSNSGKMFRVVVLENGNISFTFQGIDGLGSLTAANLALDEKGNFSYVGELRGTDNGTLVPVVIQGKLPDERVQASVDVRLDESTLLHACYGFEVSSEKSFEDNLVVSINGASTTINHQAVTVGTLDNGNINFTLKDFQMAIDNSSAYVGNIQIENLSIDTEGNFAYEGSILIGPGTDEHADWMGLDLGIVPVSMSGQRYTYQGETRLIVIIDINMQESLGQTIHVTYGADALSTKEYTDDLAVTVNGTTATQETTVSVGLLGNGNINFMLDNFCLNIEDGSKMGIGNISIENLHVDDAGNFSYDGIIRIGEGDNRSVSSWAGPDLGDVPVVLNGQRYTVDGTEYLLVSIDIDMESSIQQTINVLFGGTPVSTQTYTDQLVVTINDETLTQPDTEVTVGTLRNDNINFVLNNFSLKFDEENTIDIGNIAVNNLTVNEDGKFSYTGSVRIGNGDDAAVSWMGPQLGAVPMNLNGKLRDGSLYVAIDIDMQESLGQTIYVEFGAEFLPGDVNGDDHISASDVPGFIRILLGQAKDVHGSADLDGDASYTITDLRMLIELIMKP